MIGVANHLTSSVRNQNTRDFVFGYLVRDATRQYVGGMYLFVGGGERE